MHRMMLWMVMLMGAAAATGQETAIRSHNRATRRDAVAELGRRVERLLQALDASRRGLPAASNASARTSRADEAAKAKYTKRIKELRAKVLDLPGGANRKSDQQAAPDNATPAEPEVGSTNQANTANQADGAGTTRQSVTPSRRYHYLQGKLAHNNNQHEKALNSFQQVDDPGKLGLSDAQNLHLLKAINLRKLKKYQEAAAEYQALLNRLPPGDPLRTTVEWFQLHCEWLARNTKSQQAPQ